MRITSKTIEGYRGSLDHYESEIYKINGELTFTGFTPIYRSSDIYAKIKVRGGDMSNYWQLIYPSSDVNYMYGEYSDDYSEFKVHFKNAEVTDIQFKEEVHGTIIKDGDVEIPSLKVHSSCIIESGNNNYLELKSNYVKSTSTKDKIYANANGFSFDTYCNEGKLKLKRTSSTNTWPAVYQATIKKPFPVGITTWVIKESFSKPFAVSYGQLPYSGYYNDKQVNVSLIENDEDYILQIIIDSNKNFSIDYYTIEYDYASSYSVPNNVDVYYGEILMQENTPITHDIFKTTLIGNSIVTTYSSGFQSNGAPIEDIPDDKWFKKIERKPISNMINFKNKNDDLTIDNNINVTGGMTLGGSLTIPSDKSIEIGEINLKDLEKNRVATSGYFYIYYNSSINTKPTLFYYDTSLSNQNIYVASNYKLEMPANGQVFTISGQQVSQDHMYRLPIQIKKITT